MEGDVMKLSQEEFQIEFFRDTDTVTVNAVKLQKLIREKEELERTLKKLEKQLDTANALLEYYKETSVQAGDYVDLKI